MVASRTRMFILIFGEGEEGAVDEGVLEGIEGGVEMGEGVEVEVVNGMDIAIVGCE